MGLRAYVNLNGPGVGGGGVGGGVVPVLRHQPPREAVVQILHTRRVMVETGFNRVLVVPLLITAVVAVELVLRQMQQR
jgi:hypothetical protein